MQERIRRVIIQSRAGRFVMCEAPPDAANATQVTEYDFRCYQDHCAADREWQSFLMERWQESPLDT